MENTTWLTVKTFRSLAENVAISLRRGTPVIVVGRLRTDVWDDPKTGERQERQVLEATTVGHDLSLGSSRFKRNDREPEETPAAVAVASEEEATETRELAMA
ncbi:single-stranded DNA-binding protein [Propionibacteriaceae bacterium Y1700]|uniref:single-stranded DNA-binding protein n=1 Tax=Microlunatus sp. Y1700 TaxID=3418487 RepID=UPI003DA722BE